MIRLTSNLRAAIRKSSYKACPQCRSVMACTAVWDGCRALTFVCPHCGEMLTEYATKRSA